MAQTPNLDSLDLIIKVATTSVAGVGAAFVAMFTWVSAVVRKASDEAKSGYEKQIAEVQGQNKALADQLGQSRKTERDVWEDLQRARNFLEVDPRDTNGNALACIRRALEHLE